MTDNIDRNRVRKAFSSQAAEYDRYAVVQKRVVARLLSSLHELDLSPECLLDIGAGTGTFLGWLNGLYPQACITGADLAFGMCAASMSTFPEGARGGIICADAEHLPFAGGSFDLVVSTSTFQWLPRLDDAISEAYRVMAPGAYFTLALFGEKTLYELRNSYRRAAEQLGRAEERTHSFHTTAEVEKVLTRSGFSCVRVWSELESEHHPDVPHLLRSLRKIGAGNASPVHTRGLAERRTMQTMMAVYQSEYGSTQGIPATYEVVYAFARRPLDLL